MVRQNEVEYDILRVYIARAGEAAIVGAYIQAVFQYRRRIMLMTARSSQQNYILAAFVHQVLHFCCQRNIFR